MTDQKIWLTAFILRKHFFAIFSVIKFAFCVVLVFALITQQSSSNRSFTVPIHRKKHREKWTEEISYEMMSLSEDLNGPQQRWWKPRSESRRGKPRAFRASRNTSTASLTLSKRAWMKKLLWPWNMIKSHGFKKVWVSLGGSVLIMTKIRGIQALMVRCHLVDQSTQVILEPFLFWMDETGDSSREHRELIHGEMTHGRGQYWAFSIALSIFRNSAEAYSRSRLHSY